MNKKLGLLCSLMALALSSSPAWGDVIAYWPFGTSGFQDASGNNHALAGVNVTADGAGYVTLNGTNAYLKTSSSLDLSALDQVTFECWAKPSEKKSQVGLLMSSAEPTTAGGFVLYLDSKLQSQYRMLTTGDNPWQIDTSAAANPLSDGAWHHVAYVLDRTRTDHQATRLYIDGVEQSNASSRTGELPAFFNEVFHIGGGAAYVSGNNFFSGLIDDVRISNAALAPEDFLSFPSVGPAMRAGANAQPVLAYWPFGPKGAEDVSGNGFNLKMDGVPIVSGTPSPSWATLQTQKAFSTLSPLPFSAFSRVGFTLECYVKSDTSSTKQPMLLELTESYWNNVGSFSVGYPENGYTHLQTTFRDPSGGIGTSTETTHPSPNDGRWHHVAVVYDPATPGENMIRLYLDGVRAPGVASSASPIVLKDGILYFTRRADTQNLPFYGSLDDVRITAGALAPGQFLPQRSDNLVALWRFNSETLDDFSGNGHELVYENGPATFGDAGNPASGIGVLVNQTGAQQWLHTLNTLDLTYTKTATIECEYFSGWSGGANWVLVANYSTTPVGSFVMYNPGTNIISQFRTVPGTWQQERRGISNGHHYLTLALDATASGSDQSVLHVDGVEADEKMGNSGTISNLTDQVFCIGHSPGYSSSNYLKGKFITVAISDVVLDLRDSVSSNLPPLACASEVLAYWPFKTQGTDASGNGHTLSASGDSYLNQSLRLDASTHFETSPATALDLAPFSQVTVEAFVRFQNPADGTILAYGDKDAPGSFILKIEGGRLVASAVPYAGAVVGGSADISGFDPKSWHHVAFVVDQTPRKDIDRARLYVDYVRADLGGRSTTRFAMASSGAFTIGSFAGSSAASGCYLDDVRVSAGALPTPDLSFLQPNDRTEVPSGLLFVVR
ncbi:MAG: LamG-like jellyroll fold domain-containing protein [Kiritimatiellia bacterium]|jgi:hypothetical protein